MERPDKSVVEIRFSARTLASLIALAAVVALALLSLGTLISILLAAVLAFGLDPVVGALVQRGWKRGPAALVVFAALFAAVFVLVLVTAGPVWSEIVEFINALPGYWDELTAKPALPGPHLHRGRRRPHRASCSRTSPPVCPTPPAPSSASPGACSARCSRS